MKKLLENKIILVIIIVVAVIWIIDGYDYVMGLAFKICDFEGAYYYEESENAIAVIFDEDEMILYLDGFTGSTKTIYEYEGRFYNKGLFNKFKTPGGNWETIEDADRAGSFFAKCKKSVYSNAWGDIIYTSEDQIEAIEEESGKKYSRTFYFKIKGDQLTLILMEDEGPFYIPLNKVNVITGDFGDMIEGLDYLEEYYSSR